MLIGVILIIGCERRIKSSRECSYSHKKNYDPIRVAFDFDKIWSSSLLNDIQPDSSDSEIIKIIYKSNDTSLDTIYQLTVLMLMDNKKCYLSYKRRNGKSDSIIKIDRNNHSFKKLKQYINLLPNEHLTRDCLVSDGTDAVCVVKKRNEFYNSFVSYGYDCWVDDSSKVPTLYFNIFNLVNKLTKFSKF